VQGTKLGLGHIVFLTGAVNSAKSLTDRVDLGGC
jgi:hypothetical protein